MFLDCYYLNYTIQLLHIWKHNKLLVTEPSYFIFVFKKCGGQIKYFPRNYLLHDSIVAVIYLFSQEIIADHEQEVE